MKTVLMKIFMIIAAALCMFEGLVLIAIGLGRLTPEKLLAIYNSFINSPRVLMTLLGIGLFFVLLGFTLLIISSRTKPPRKMITVQKEGKILSIPQQTIESFITQIIEQNPYVSDTSMEFKTKGECTDILIKSGFNGVPSVQAELQHIEEVLTNEIKRVFDWNDFKFSFQLRGMTVDPNKKYFSSGNVQADEIINNDLTVDAPFAQEQEKERVPPAKGKSKSKDKSKDKTLFSKMLWGKE